MKNISLRPQRGFSMMELMISITIGLLLLTGLASLFSKSSTSQNEIRRAAAQIENGRYAMDTLIQDLQLAGYLGQYRKTTSPATLPDPCLLTVAGLTTAIGMPVQGYNAASLTARPDLSATTCSTWLLNANLSPGSDVLIVRRADTNAVAIGTVTTAGTMYLQNNPVTIEVQQGGGTTSCTSKADGTASTITRRCITPAASDLCPALCPGGSPVGYVRELHVNIYFVAPCNVPATGTTCTGANDDNGRPIPTLKRLELTASGGAATFKITPIAEGVEYMKIGYGIDDTPAAGCTGTPCVNADTGLVGDGATDRYVLAPTAADLANVVTVRMDLLVRNPEPSFDYVDAKTYKLGSDPTTPTNPAVTITASTDLDTRYRRHVYNSEIRLINLSGRKEIP